MCCLFGFVDYAGSLSVKQRNHLIRELSIAAEVRGTDATGIAYNTSRANLQASAGGASAASTYSCGGSRRHGTHADDDTGQCKEEL